MFKHILVPLDGSLLAEEAIEPAVCLARAYGSHVTLLRAAITPQLAISRLFVGLPDAADFYLALRQVTHDQACSYLEEQYAKWRHAGITLHTRVSQGVSVAEDILSVARASGIDLIVMTTHGRSGFSRWMLGSVAEQVARDPSVPVLLLRRSNSDKRHVGQLDKGSHV